MEEDLNDPDDNTHETEISTKVLSLQRKAKIFTDDIIQDCIKQLLQDMDLAKKECVQVKGDYNRLHMELDQSREALKRTKRLNATNKDDARPKQSYEQMRKDAKLIGIIKTKAAKKSNKAVWGVTILENKMYVVSRWTPEVEVFETVKFTCINRCTLDGLDNPEDIRASVKGKHLFIMDATRPAKAKKILRVEPNGMKVAMNWKIGDHEAILSVTEESNVIATVYENHQLIEYTSDGEEVRRIDLSNTGMMHPWHAVKLSNGHFLVCHGHYDEPVHRVCEIDNNGLISKSYADTTNVHNLDVPANLAVDKFGSIILADYNNGVILLLNSDLECKKVLLSKEFGIRRPTRIHLDEENDRLFIADNEMGWKNGRVLVFEITKYKFTASPLITRLIKNNCRITTFY